MSSGHPISVSLILIFLLLTTSHLSKGAPREEETDWRTLAIRDLKDANRILSQEHPGPVDKENPFFRDWMLRGTQESMKLIERVENEFGYRYALLYYIKGFQDSHLNFDFSDKLEAPNLEWPGLIIAYRQNQFVVHYRSKDTKLFGELPPINSILLSCDGRKVLDILQTDVLPYMGNPNLQAHWVMYSPYILFDHKNPFVQRPRNCIFQEGKTRRAYNFNYHPALTHLKDPLTKASFGTSPEMNVKKIKKNFYWVNIPSFQIDQAKDRKRFFRLISTLKKIRSAQKIVIDLRHNRGGAPRWGDEVLNALFTPEYTSYRLFAKPSRRYGQIRVSPENLKHYQGILNQLKKQGLKKSPSYRAIETSIASIQFGLKKGLALTPAPSRNESYPSPVRAEIYFLTDGHCASACLIFADKLLQFPRVAHIGFPTSADSTYLEGRYKTLYSNLTRLYFAVLVDRYRSRGYNEPLEPLVTWHGDWDNRSLMEWVAQLPSPSLLRKENLKTQ